MKPPRTPLSRHFFNPSSSSDLKHGQKGPHHTVVSYFLSSKSNHALHSSKNPKSCLKDSSFGKPQKNLDTVTKNSGDVSSENSHFLLSSTKNGKPIIKIAYFDQMASQFSQTRLFSAASNDLSRKPRFVIGLAKNEKPIIRTAFCDQMVSQFAQTRLFSAGPNDSSGDAIPVVATTRSPFDSSPTIDAGSSIRKPISLWPGMYNSPVTNALWEARSSIFERPSNAKVDPSASSDLTSKTPSQSRTRVLYNFSSDYVLREQYRNPWNEIRMGKLLEDLDALAGTISFKHCANNDGTTRSLLLVTASVDKMLLKKPIRVDTDLTVEGAVTWVGRSSMDIQLEVMQTSPEASSTSESLALTANFTFVARDSETGKSAPINQILPETEKEKLLWEEAEERNKFRKKKKGQKKDVEGEEANGLNELLAEGRIFCDMPALADRDSILMKDTCLQNSLVCQPQQRNIHGRIFGGFLMRRAFELAYATAYAFAGSAPCFVEVDHVDFLKPVDVGNFLRLKSCVLYTELEDPSQPLINVEVVAHVTRPELRSSEVSNNFYFTFTVQPDSLKDGKKIRNVVPATQEEALRVIERMDAEKS